MYARQKHLNFQSIERAACDENIRNIKLDTALPIPDENIWTI